MIHPRLISLILTIAASIVLADAACAHAAQILINPGDDWEKKAARARPGDEIILLPGRHRPATFERLHGSPGSPITIRAAAKDKPTIIAATLDGLRIKDAAHIVIRDIQITGGSASGIWLAGASAPSAPTESADGARAQAPTRARDIYIDNVSISRIGPRGERHGLILAGFADVRINRLQVEGWGGSAVELIACEDVAISRSAFRGLSDHSQACGIRARAGSDRVSITESRFENAGDIAVCMGGRSNPDEFIPPLPAGAASPTVAEAMRIMIDQSIIVGSLCPIAFIHATDCVVRSNTIYRPTRCVFALLQQNPDLAIRPNARNLFGGNLITWKAGDVSRLVEADEGVTITDFILEQNLWWSDDPPDRRDKLGPLPGRPEQTADQLFDVNPQFSETLKPGNPDARAFGVSI